MNIQKDSGRKNTGRTDKYSDETPRKDYEDFRKDHPKDEIDRKNPKKPFVEEKSKILKGWERNLPQIEKLIKAIASKATYSYEEKVYQAMRILRKFGGNTNLGKSLVDKYVIHM